MKTKILLILVAASLIFSSCYKEGPVGPSGPRGADGRDGVDGQTSKVYYFDVKLKDFKAQGYNSSWVNYSYINGVTVTDLDMVLAYVNLSSDGNGDNYWQAMPHNEYVDNSEFFIEHSFGIMGIDDDTGNNNYLAGDFMFSLRTNTGVAPYNPMNSLALLRYNVYILKGTQGKSAKLPDYVNKNNKMEVEAYVKNLTTVNIK